MNTQVVTTGLVPFTINSRETFELRPVLNGVPWQLTGGSVNLVLADPNGNLTTVGANVLDYAALATWTVVGPAGQWTLAFDVTDSSGLRQVTRPVPFTVVSSPA